MDVMDDIFSTPTSFGCSTSPGTSSCSEYTPATILTQPSPNIYRYAVNEDSGEAITQVYSPLSFSRLNPNLSSEAPRSSPWVEPTVACNASAVRARTHSAKLSPTAPPFTPRATDIAQNTYSGMNSSNIASSELFSTPEVHEVDLVDPFTHTNKNEYLDLSSSASFNSMLLSPIQPEHPLRGYPFPIARCSNDGPEDASTENPHTVDLGCATRFIEISRIHRTFTVEQLSSTLNNESFTPPALVVITELVTRGIIYLHFTDIRDARTAVAELNVRHPHWKLKFIDHAYFSNVNRPVNSSNYDTCESGVLATAICDGPRHAFDISQVAKMVKDFLISFGELLSWKIVSTEFPQLSIQADYYDTLAAKDALTSNSFKHDGVTVTLQWTSYSIVKSQDDIIEARKPIREATKGYRDLNTSYTRRCSYPPSVLSGVANDLQSRLRPRVSSESAPASQIQSSSDAEPFDAAPIGDSPVHEGIPASFSQQTGISGSFPKRVTFGTRMHRGSYPKICRQPIDYPSVQHNVVEVDRIRQGLDVRTTVMLRNIPNKINQGMLKDILDETSYGKYDFMYLRIDFANNCNVGYAFINFEDPWFIIDFVRARAGRRWNRFHSDKIAEVSYATIQGKDCLIQKFRNSSVMMEHPSFRPKIFKTGNGPDAGFEEEFPGPDNSSKMRRSVENAEHVGLFAPRGIYQHREEQRRRKSQYDRGTPHAELEFMPEVHPRTVSGRPRLGNPVELQRG